MKQIIIAYTNMMFTIHNNQIILVDLYNYYILTYHNQQLLLDHQLMVIMQQLMFY